MQNNMENQNAKKWTAEKVMSYLLNIEHEALKPDTIYLGNALNNEGLYKDVWRYWKQLLAHDSDIQEKMLRIESLFEARLFIGGLKKELAPTLTIFGLKNNHKWKDKYSQGL